MKDFRKLKDMAIKPRTHPAFFYDFFLSFLKKAFFSFQSLDGLFSASNSEQAGRVEEDYARTG